VTVCVFINLEYVSFDILFYGLNIGYSRDLYSSLQCLRLSKQFPADQRIYTVLFLTPFPVVLVSV